MKLIEAINKVETAVTDLGTADATQAAAVAKYEAALSAKQSADQADADAVKLFNEALDGLIAAATEAKR